MAYIIQTTFSNGFSWIKTYEFWLRFHWNLFLSDTFSLFLSIFYISQRLTLWYFVFLYLIFLSQQVLYFLLSTLVLTLYIDVVLSLSIPKVRIYNIPALAQTKLGAAQATSHYLKQWWLVYWRIYASVRLNEFKHCSGVITKYNAVVNFMNIYLWAAVL